MIVKRLDCKIYLGFLNVVVVKLLLEKNTREKNGERFLNFYN